MDPQNDHDLLIALHTEVQGIRQDLKDFKQNYVTKSEFEPVRAIAYGMVAAIVLAVVGAILTLVFK